MAKKVFNTEAPQLNLPANVKEGGARVDWRPDISADGQVEWHGLRYAWTRMTLCPCAPFNDQTQQVRPDCPKCNGQGWRPFRPANFVLRIGDVGRLTDVQIKLITDNSSTVISCLTTSVQNAPDMYNVMGELARGSVLLTYDHRNKVGYYDRMTNLDVTAPFSQMVQMPAENRLKLRYPAEELNALMTDDAVFKEGDVTLDQGDVVFASGKQPAAGTLVSVHYLRWPTFAVLEFPHFIRSTVVRTKVKRSKRARPVGDILHLPLQCMARLEHLPLKVSAT